LKNGHTIASVKDSETGATVAFVQNEKGTVLQREVTYADGLGTDRTQAVQDALAQVIIRTDSKLRQKAGSKLSA